MKVFDGGFEAKVGVMTESCVPRVEKGGVKDFQDSNNSSLVKAA